MKQSVKIAIVAGSAVVLFSAIVLGRYLYSEIERLKVGEPIIVPQDTTSTTDVVVPTSTPPTDNAAPTTTKVEFKSPDDWTSVVLPNGTNLTNPFIFYGTTTAFENNISWRLLDENGVQISIGYTYVNSPDVGIPGPIKVKAFFDSVPATKTGKLQVYEASAKDGEPIHIAEVQVTFPSESQVTTVYFGNTEKAPEGEECETVYPVERMTVAGNTAEIAIHELLRGPNLLESNSDYFTSLPENIPDPDISFKKDGIYLDFTEALQYQVGGSCRVTSIRKQIEETVKKATNEENVVISIDGDSETILQP